MKQLCLLLLVAIGLSQAVQYRRTVSYEGELVARWYNIILYRSEKKIMMTCYGVP